MTDEEKELSELERPTQVGPFKILDVLGEGGMSIVYLAEQKGPVSRQVALKVLKPGMDTRQVIARFETERQALAVLDHPNIAKIYEGGVTEHGRPYFAMERVNGIPINEYCDNNRLTNRQRVRVFVDVCSAVQHAHHKGLIHRDLKPSNILVGVTDGDPHIKVIDFGIAKATGASLTDKTLFTRVGQLIGTPQYMSPEQADSSGLDVDTRADIYSLGVILYELLVGAVPLELAQIADHAVRLALKEKDPPKPSTRITQLGDTSEEVAKARRARLSDLKQDLSGDLDWIVMKAIEKDRTRRYETANALSMECRRYLKHEPVLARAPSTGYLLQRFVRRNRTVVGWASVAILSIIAGAAATTVGMIQAQRAEQIAITEAETTESVYRFLVSLFGVSNPFDSDKLSSDVSARDLVERGAARLESDLIDSPIIRARLMNTLGIILTNLGELDRARELIDEALNIRENVIPASDNELADSHYALGEVSYETGSYADAAHAFRTAVKLYEGVDGRISEHVADTLEFMAAAHSQQSQFKEAIDALKESGEILQQLPGTDDYRLGVSFNALGFTHSLSGDYVNAAPAYEQAVQYFQSGPKTGAYARAAANLATSYQLTGQTERAIKAHEEALALKREVFGPDHIEVAFSLNNLANIRRDRGEIAEALALLEESLSIFTNVLGPGHGNVAVVRVGIGNTMAEAGRFDEARMNFEEAWPVIVNVFGDGSMRDIQVLNGIGYVALKSGDHSTANAMFVEAINKGRAIGTSHTELGSALIGRAASLPSDDEETSELYSAGLDMLEASAGPESLRTIDARRWYARFLNQNARRAEAHQEFSILLTLLGRTLGKDNATYRQYREEFERDFSPVGQ